MTRVLADALVPIFAGLLLGYLAGRWRVMDNQNVGTLITFVMSFAIPCSLFLAVASTPLAALRDQAAAALVLTIVYVAVYVISFFWTRSRENLSRSDSSVVALTLGFPNSAAVGLPLLGSVFGSQSTVTVATSLAIGSITISPVTLAILGASRSGGRFTLGQMSLSLIRSFKKPIVWGPVAWAGVFFCGLESSFFRASISRRDGLGGRRFGSCAYRSGRVCSSVRNPGRHPDCSFSEESAPASSCAWACSTNSSHH